MPAIPFTVDCGETRAAPAGAMVVADRWARGGCSDILTTNPSGQAMMLPADVGSSAIGWGEGLR